MTKNARHAVQCNVHHTTSVNVELPFSSLAHWEIIFDREQRSTRGLKNYFVVVVILHQQILK